jgi:hypothetical protein
MQADLDPAMAELDYVHLYPDHEFFMQVAAADHRMAITLLLQLLPIWAALAVAAMAAH